MPLLPVVGELLLQKVIIPRYHKNGSTELQKLLRNGLADAFGGSGNQGTLTLKGEEHMCHLRRLTASNNPFPNTSVANPGSKIAPARKPAPVSL